MSVRAWSSERMANAVVPDTDEYNAFNRETGKLGVATALPAFWPAQSRFFNGEGNDFLVDIIFARNRETALGGALDVSPDSTQRCRIHIPKRTFITFPPGILVAAARPATAGGSTINWEMLDGEGPSVQVEHCVDAWEVVPADSGVSRKLTDGGWEDHDDAANGVDMKGIIICNNRGGVGNTHVWCRQDPKFLGNINLTAQANQFWPPGPFNTHIPVGGRVLGFPGFRVTGAMANETNGTVIGWS